MQYVYMYLISVPIFVFFDYLWIGFIARDLYQEKLGFLLGDVQWVAAVIFYALFLAGLTFFVIEPAVSNASILRALGAGMFFGLVTYATYDLTNQATIKDWPLMVTVVDMMWGMVLGGAVSALTYIVYRMLV